MPCPEKIQRKYRYQFYLLDSEGDFMQEEILLNNVKAIAEKYEFLRKETGGDFNIFEIANISAKEVTICRVLYDLLSPNGSHHQGDKYLRLFVENVLRLENCTETEWAKAKVYREYLLPSGRRIDLVIETEKPSRFIPIEVKIYAEEQEKQCIDYWKYANEQQNHGKSVLYYLTRFGDEPSGYSKGENEDCEIACISFAKDILGWLSLCIKETDTWRLAPIREVMVQFMTAIRKFTGCMEDGEMEEIKNLLRYSPEYMKSIMDLEQAAIEVRKDVLKDLLLTIEKKIDNSSDIKMQKNNIWCYFAENKYSRINDFYSKNTWPGIGYFCSFLSNNAEITLRLEIMNEIKLGYANTDNGGYQPKKIADADCVDELFSRLKDDFYGYAKYDRANGSGWLVYQNISLEEAESPNFKNPNSAFYRLLDKDYFERFTSKCGEAMIGLLKK